MRIYVPWRIRKAAEILLAPIGRKQQPVAQSGLQCAVCGTANAEFLPLPAYYDDMKDRYGFIHSIHLSETMNRRQYSCAHCGATDRERLYALYLRDFVSQGGVLRDILDIAPAQPLAALLKRLGATGYRSADVSMPGVDDSGLDIQNMSTYADGQFRIFICSHVLEHVADDMSAMRELYRVLAPGGWGICMVPINLGLAEVYENPAIVDEAGRWKHFGQNDHLRLYSKAGFVNRLTDAGFQVAQHGTEHFGEKAFARHAIHPRSVLYVAHKR
jgi:predicted SAM-dependent methyltransferase